MAANRHCHCIATACLVATPACVCAQPWFTGVGVVPGTGGLPSIALGVSGDGNTVVGFGGATQEQVRAFAWTLQSGTKSLGSLPNGNGISSASALNADGSVIVGYGITRNTSEAFRWTEVGGMKALGLFPGSWSSSAQGVSGDGDTIVGWGFTNNGGREAFRWTESNGMVGLGDLPGGNHDSWAFDVADDGNTIIGDANDGQGQFGFQGFRWTPQGGMTALPNLPGYSGSRARGISPDGQYIVGSNDSPGTSVAVLWTPSGPVNLGTLPGSYAGGASDVSADASVVVGSSFDGAQSAAFYWMPSTGMLNLKEHLLGLGVAGLEGWTLQAAYGLSDDGLTICGIGINPQGLSEGWVAHVPSPGSLACFALATVVGAAPSLARRRRC